MRQTFAAIEITKTNRQLKTGNTSIYTYKHIHTHYKDTYINTFASCRLPTLANGTEAASLATVATAVDFYATAIANANAICSMPHALDYTNTDS